MNETNEKKNVSKSTGTSGRYRKTPAKKTAEAPKAAGKPAVAADFGKRRGCRLRQVSW